MSLGASRMRRASSRVNGSISCSSATGASMSRATLWPTLSRRKPSHSLVRGVARTPRIRHAPVGVFVVSRPGDRGGLLPCQHDDTDERLLMATDQRAPLRRCLTTPRTFRTSSLVSTSFSASSAVGGSPSVATLRPTLPRRIAMRPRGEGRSVSGVLHLHPWGLARSPQGGTKAEGDAPAGGTVAGVCVPVTCPSEL
jgi:hypothetical protein